MWPLIILPPFISSVMWPVTILAYMTCLYGWSSGLPWFGQVGRKEYQTSLSNAEVLVMSATQKGSRKGRREKSHPQNGWERSVKWTHLKLENASLHLQGWIEKVVKVKLFSYILFFLNYWFLMFSSVTPFTPAFKYLGAFSVFRD